MSDKTDINVGHNVRCFKIFFIYTVRVCVCVGGGGGSDKKCQVVCAIINQKTSNCSKWKKTIENTQMKFTHFIYYIIYSCLGDYIQHKYSMNIHCLKT